MADGGTIEVAITDKTHPMVKRACQFLARLIQMQGEGSSVTLNWGEDTGYWEASWITGGRRYTAFNKEPDVALREAMGKAVGPVALDYAAISSGGERA